MTDLFGDMTETSQFGSVPRRTPAAARATDPASSHAAASRMNESGRAAGNAAIVLAAVRRWPGRTAIELCAESEREAGRRPAGCHLVSNPAILDRVEVGRRLDSLVKAGLVRKGEPRECRVKKVAMLTWWPAGPGHA